MYEYISKSSQLSTPQDAATATDTTDWKTKNNINVAPSTLGIQ